MGLLKLYYKISKGGKQVLDLNAIINEEVHKAYLKGRRDMAGEIKDIFVQRDSDSDYENKMLDKLFEELNNKWT